MSANASTGRPRTPLVAALCAGLAACLAPVEREDAGAAVARATGGDALAFRGEALPLEEPPLGADSLPLAIALRQALESSPELQAALARVRVAEAEADQARLLPNPVLDIVLRFPSGGGGTEIEAGIAAGLFELLSRPRRASAAEDRLAARVAEAVTVALDVVAEVRAAYVTAQAEEALAARAGERAERLARLLAGARTRAEAGEGTRLDVTTLEAQALEVELELEERAAGQRRARLALARWIGRPSDGAEWALEPLIPPPPLALDEREWIARTLSVRPELRAMEWRLAALGEEAGLARGEVLAGTELGLDANREGRWSLGPSLALPLPVFDSGDARQRRAAAAWVEARDEWIAAARQAIEEVRGALAELGSARARLARVDGRLLPLEQERRSQAEQLFLAGEVDVTALLLAEQALGAASERRIALAAELTRAQAALERAAGGSGPAESNAGPVEGLPAAREPAPAPLSGGPPGPR